MTKARRWLPLLLFGIVFVSALRPIRSYDGFWHLATGRWIVEHRALPLNDPFALASEQIRWINGEWLFQIILFGIEQLGGFMALGFLAGFLAGLSFALGAREATRWTSPGAAMLIGLIGWLGAAHRIDARPETAGIAMLAVFVAFALDRPTRFRNVGLVLVTMLWINLHPSALLAPPALALIVTGEALSGEVREKLRVRTGQLVLVTLSLLVNPWLVDGILAPFRLAGFLTREGIVNREWLPTDPAVFPLVYVSIVAGGVLLLASPDRKRLLPRTLLFAFLSILAARFVRNHGFLFAAMPLLLAPAIPALRPPMRKALGVIAAVLAAVLILASLPPRFGPHREIFPVESVAQLKAAGLKGNIYNPDQLGGYLIWSFHPARRVLTDGRNELFRDYIRLYGRSRVDSRIWAQLLRKYEIDLAVEEYRNAPVEVVDARTGRRDLLPASSVYFPPERWALIAFDDAAMILARREAFDPAKLASMELRSLVPDGFSAATVIRGDPEQARKELGRAQQQLGPSRRLEILKELLGGRPRNPIS
ncbi:MAG TPA: hypothetical protein VM534_11575 [Thermoanaerobaculia bacterium]|nr:hypothetical protein [Thermoanaerobaculia bacterium]